MSEKEERNARPVVSERVMEYTLRTSHLLRVITRAGPNKTQYDYYTLNTFAMTYLRVYVQIWQ